MISMDDYFISLKFTPEPIAVYPDDPTRYLSETSGIIEADDDINPPRLMGKFRLFYVNVLAALEAGEPLDAIMDEKDETWEYYGALFEPGTDRFLRSLRGQLNDWYGAANVLIVSRLEILPEFRMRGNGLAVLARLIDHFSVGAGLVVIKPFPLQETVDFNNEPEWSREVQLGTFNRDFDKSVRKLRQHYASLGFKRIGRSAFMFMEPTTHRLVESGGIWS